MKKLLTIGIIILIFGMSVPSTGINVEKSNAFYDGNTLYVGGNGPSNFTKIQDAIENASDGDIIYVYSGIYFENIIVENSINLIGEDRNNTIIDGSIGELDYVVYLLDAYVTMTGFCINGGKWGGILIDNYYGDSYNTTIFENSIDNNYYLGIGISKSSNNNIFSNNISNNYYGIAIDGMLDKANNNSIFQNNIMKNKRGICILNRFDEDNKIYHNNFFL